MFYFDDALFSPQNINIWKKKKKKKQRKRNTSWEDYEMQLNFKSTQNYVWREYKLKKKKKSYEKITSIYLFVYLKKKKKMYSRVRYYYNYYDCYYFEYKNISTHIRLIINITASLLLFACTHIANDDNNHYV